MAGPGDEARGAGRGGLVSRVVPVLAAAALAALAACTRPVAEKTPYAAMPVPHANNAVAAVERGGRAYLYSFMGLKPGKSHADISTAAFEYSVAEDRWRRLNPVPVPEGRLAGVAATVGGRIYLFGGYTVAADGSEESTPHVFAFDPEAETYSRRAEIPKPVDDSVALVYRDRYVYLVSGWHMDGNVPNVQVYDTARDVWFNATDFPGIPVFGHAGGIVGNTMLVIDGVALEGESDGERAFRLVKQAWLGEINPDDPSRIRWQSVGGHGGPPVYRAAATGATDRGLILFAGGANRAYNYSGIGYDGEPAAPSARVFGYDLLSDIWLGFADKPVATMDHRGLLEAAGGFWTLGGMVGGQRVSGVVDRIDPKE